MQPGRADRGQSDADSRTDHEGPGEDQPARGPIGQVAGGQGKNEQRHKLGQPDPAQVQH